MKRILIAMVIVALLSGTCFARGWHRGGPRGCHGGGYRYNNCNDTAMWVGVAGMATALILTAALSQPQQPVVREVVPVTSGYRQVPSVMVCPNCRNQVSCVSVPAGYRASCPYCRTILY
jgi:hypothetical protein